MDLSAILKNQSSLFSFMKFLKEENALNLLQFCLSVGSSSSVLFKTGVLFTLNSNENLR
jgi:hypothetical protein